MIYWNSTCGGIVDFPIFILQSQLSFQNFVSQIFLTGDRYSCVMKCAPVLTDGCNAITWAKKFELDVWYVDNLSFLIDCKVVLITLKKVIAREDINSSTNATMGAFNGHN